MTLESDFIAARSDSHLVVLEGFHAIKHAARFGAKFERLVTSEPELTARLAAQLAPDVADLLGSADVFGSERVAKLTKRNVQTRLLGIARKKEWRLEEAEPNAGCAVVLLDDPRNDGNLGAVIRVAAGAGASGVVAIGPVDVWSPTAVRGAAGLQFAVPCLAVSGPDEVPWRIVAFDAEAPPIEPSELAGDWAFAFGSERDGLSASMRTKADRVLSLPMRPGVSSLNLATSVSAVLYLRHYAAQRPSTLREG